MTLKYHSDLGQIYSSMYFPLYTAQPSNVKVISKLKSSKVILRLNSFKVVSRSKSFKAKITQCHYKIKSSQDRKSGPRSFKVILRLSSTVKVISKSRLDKVISVNIKVRQGRFKVKVIKKGVGGDTQTGFALY